MAIALVGSATPARGGSGTATINQTTTAGNLLVLTIQHQGGAITGVSDDASNTWTKAGDTQDLGASSQRRVAVYYCLNAAAATAVTVTGSSVIQLLLDEWSGVGAFGSATVLSNAGSTTPASATVTGVSTGDLVYGCLAYVEVSAGTQLQTLQSGYTTTNAYDNGGTSTSCVTGAYSLTASGTTGPTWTMSTSASTGEVTVTFTPAATGATGTLASTETADTVAASGAEIFSGTVTSTEAADTSAASGTVLNPITGSWASTENADVLAASGAEAFSGALASTESDDSLAGTGSEAVSGTIASTEGADTLAAAGSSLSGITGALAATESGDSLAGAGSETLSGTLASTEGADTITAAGSSVTGISGALTSAEGPDSLVATGAEQMVGVLIVSEAADSLDAAGTQGIAGALSATERSDSLSAAGASTGGTGLQPGVLVPARVILRSQPVEVIDRAQAARVVIRSQPAEVVPRTVAARVISRTPGVNVTVSQDYSAVKTWTSDWTLELAQPALSGVTITAATATCSDDRVTVASGTVTGGGTSVSFKVSQTGIQTPTLVTVVVGVTLSNGDTDQRDFPIQFTDT